MKRFALFLLSLSIAVSSVVPLAPKASATSAYDNYYNSTSELTLFNNSLTACGASKNYSTTWGGLVASHYSSFATALSTGSWGVSQLPNYNSGTSNAFIVYWQESGALTLTWESWGYITVHNITKSVVVQMSSCDGSDPVLSYSDYGGGTAAYLSSNDGAVVNFLYTGAITYPTGYAGPDIVTEYISATTYTPRFTVNVSGKDVSIILCSVASQCSLPQGFGSNQGVGWSITDSSDDVVVSGSGKIIDMAIVNTSVPNFGEYTVNVWYYAPIPFIQPDDEIWNTMRLPIVVDGSTYFTGTATQNCTDAGTCDDYTPYQACFKPELPFIDLPACWHNLGVVGTLLSFDKIPMGTNFNLGGSCRTLGTLGDWLGLSNKMVCPQFPSSIRDTITPFVTFALALGVVSFIVTRTHANRTF